MGDYERAMQDAYEAYFHDIIVYKCEMKRQSDAYYEAMSRKLMPARPAKPSTRRELRCVR
jgi:hypothetical protein